MSKSDKIRLGSTRVVFMHAQVYKDWEALGNVMLSCKVSAPVWLPSSVPPEKWIAQGGTMRGLVVQLDLQFWYLLSLLETDVRLEV